MRADLGSAMKRIQLFEIEDQRWFPAYLRNAMTAMLTVVHRWLGTSDHIAALLTSVVARTGRKHFVDFCSGNGGPMLAAIETLRTNPDHNEVRLTLTDLYPNQEAIQRIAAAGNEHVEYRKQPVDATNYHAADESPIRTIICGFHHMPPELASRVLLNAMEAGDPIVVYELSDNSMPPKHLWWVGLPMNFVFGLAVAAAMRPMTVGRFCLSFLLPVLPACFAWDGAVSNARTYTVADLEELTSQLPTSDFAYRWEIGQIDARPSKQLYLLGIPDTSPLASQANC